MKKIVLLIAIVFIAGCYKAPVPVEDSMLSAAETSAAIINVPVDYPTIQKAIDAASPGAVIMVAAGTYKENIIVKKAVTLLGANANVPYGSARGPESILQPFTPGSAPISLGAGYDNVTINGFEITAPKSTNAIYCGYDGPSYLDIKFNYIHHVGTEGPGGNVYAIAYRGGANNTTDINISDNFINEVFSTTNTTSNLKNTAAIWLGQSPATGTVSNVTIERNTISNIKNIAYKMFEPSPWADVGKFTTSGIYIGIGWKSIGNVSGAIIQDNKITNIIGGIAYGIQLSGNTPGLDMKNNLIDNVSSPNLPSYSYGVGITSTNLGSASVTINNNSITNSLNGISNTSAATVKATCNWWGSNNYTKVYSKISGEVTFMPYLDNGLDAYPELIGFQPAASCDKISICHKGKTILVSWNAVKAHLAHGDQLGSCSED